MRLNSETRLGVVMSLWKGLNPHHNPNVWLSRPNVGKEVCQIWTESSIYSKLAGLWALFAFWSPLPIQSGVITPPVNVADVRPHSMWRAMYAMYATCLVRPSATPPNPHTFRLWLPAEGQGTINETPACWWPICRLRFHTTKYSTDALRRTTHIRTRPSVTEPATMKHGPHANTKYNYRVFLKILTHFFRFLLWCLLQHRIIRG